jgi:ATP-dependent Zn protease
MSFSNDGTIWSDWEEYSESKLYTLTSNDGKKTIYFKVKDHAGNEAVPVVESIILETKSNLHDSDNKEMKKKLYFVGTFIIIIIIIIIIILFILLKRKQRKKKDQEKVLTPDGIYVPPESSQKIDNIQPVQKLQNHSYTTEMI